MGPISYLIVEFPGNKMTGEGFAELDDGTRFDADGCTRGAENKRKHDDLKHLAARHRIDDAGRKRVFKSLRERRATAIARSNGWSAWRISTQRDPSWTPAKTSSIDHRNAPAVE